MGTSWRAPAEVVDLLRIVKEKHHSPRLDMAAVAVCFDDGKPFLKNKLNLGKLTKFSAAAKLWQREKYDFCLCIPSDLWSNVFNTSAAREAYLDLHLTRCSMEYIPEMYDENNKKKKVVDEHGRIKYTAEPKYDDDGNPKWKIEPMDLEVFAKNVSRYGLWQDDLFVLHEAMNSCPNT